MFPLSTPGRRRRFLGALLTAFVLLSWPAAIWAHPLGNFTVNRYSRLEPGRDQIDLIYVVDMAEIAAFQERQRIDGDANSAISPVEQSSYLTAQTRTLQENLHLQMNGRDLQLQARSQALSFPSGQGGLSTLRLVIHFSAEAPAGVNGGRVAYRDDNFADRLGWQEIVVRAGPGVRVIDATAPAEDSSDELRSYPQDLLQNPLAVREASFRFEPATRGENARPAAQPETAAATRARDPFTALIERPIASPGALALVLILAFGWGAAHALTPGHGKTVVGAYLVGSRGTARHALFLGLTTTLAHTAGVFILGFVTLFASRYILPEQLYPWLSAASGLLVAGLGLSLLRQRLAAWRHEQTHAHHHPHHHTHGPAHTQRHEHDQPSHEHDHHDHDHSHHHHEHSHLPPGAQGEAVTWRSLLALGISGGLVPCPSALVVMLGAIALQRVGLGLLLIVAFSLGLAGVLTAIGVIFVHAGRLVERLPRRRRLLTALPLASAGLVVLLGLGITWQALIQAGAIPLIVFSLTIP
jgi:ABC-type nickel/cobalt efflux system permease component RcnA